MRGGRGSGYFLFGSISVEKAQWLLNTPTNHPLPISSPTPCGWSSWGGCYAHVASLESFRAKVLGQSWGDRYINIVIKAN